MLDDEWERYVKRMMRNAGTFISPDEGKQIYEFLTYDSKIRKKALYDKKLKAAPPPRSRTEPACAMKQAVLLVGATLASALVWTMVAARGAARAADRASTTRSTPPG